MAVTTLFHWDLSSEINWDAVGAAATVGAAAATGFAAYVGLRAVDNWKQGNLHKGAVESILAFENAANEFKHSLRVLEFNLIVGINDKEPTGEAKKQKEILHTSSVRAAIECENQYERLRKQLIFYVPAEQENLLTANQIHRSFDGIDSGPGKSKRFEHVEVVFSPVFTRLNHIKAKFR